MRSVILASIVLVAAATFAVAHVLPLWTTVAVMPKDGAVLMIGEKTVDCSRASHPWAVHQVNGKWLWVGEQPRGWVRQES